MAYVIGEVVCEVTELLHKESSEFVRISHNPLNYHIISADRLKIFIIQLIILW